MIAALVGDPARANILTALMTGRALTASELAHQAGVTPQTASSHLAKLEAGGLIAQEKQGRHRYYRLADPDVASVLEGLEGLAARAGHLRVRTGPKDPALRRARVCYDHLAGEIAVALTDAMIARGQIEIGADGAALTDRGRFLLAEIGVELPPEGKGAVFCRPCLDWSERRHHLAGMVGAALYRTLLARNWIRRSADSRTVTVTPPGRTALSRYFGVSV